MIAVVALIAEASRRHQLHIWMVAFGLESVAAIAALAARPDVGLAVQGGGELQRGRRLPDPGRANEKVSVGRLASEHRRLERRQRALLPNRAPFHRPLHPGRRLFGVVTQCLRLSCLLFSCSP
jgi:hypothetical protein